MRQFVIEGNTRDGRLIKVGVAKDKTKQKYEGERIAKGGKFETREFIGKEVDVRRQWRTWQIDGRKQATITVDKAAGKPREGKQVAQTKQQPEKIYVLAFVDAYEKRTDIGAYLDMDKAADMVDALTVAANATGQKGEYDVFQLEVRG